MAPVWSQVVVELSAPDPMPPTSPLMAFCCDEVIATYRSGVSSVIVTPFSDRMAAATSAKGTAKETKTSALPSPAMSVVSVPEVYCGSFVVRTGATLRLALLWA